MLVSCVACSLNLKIEATCSSETSVLFHELHVFVSQNIELFITTAVREPQVLHGSSRSNLVLGRERKTKVQLLDRKLGLKTNKNFEKFRNVYFIKVRFILSLMI
jgi:hypothetical protein